MLRSFFVGLGLLMVLAVAVPCRADLSLTLSSSDDLSMLQVGDTVHIDVVLAGLDLQQVMDLLSADVIYPSALLGPPTITPGAIIPDSTGFISTSSPGRASAFYDVILSGSGDSIATNGVFLSFTAQALAPGSGSIGFDPNAPPTGLLIAGGVPDDAPIGAGTPLPFTIRAQVNPIPEPSTLALAGVALLLGGSWAVRTQRRRRAA